MKKYYLQPTWDIIPHETGVTLVSLKRDHQIELNDYVGHPPLTVFFAALITGQTMRDLQRKALVPAPELTKLIKRLVQIDLVTTKAKSAPKAITTDYLVLLHQNIIGPGKIMTHNETIATNPLANVLSVGYSLGFAPRLIPHQSSLNEGWGADSDQKLSLIKSAVEGVERYALGDYDLNALHSATWTDLKDKTPTPTQLGTTASTLQKTNAIHWTSMQHITKPTELFLPIDAVYHPVDYTELNRPPICPMNISGVAAHQSKEAAIINGLLELCEHEALMVTWFGNRTTPTINPETIDPLYQSYIRQAKQLGWQIILKDISLDLTPVVLAIGLGPKGKRALTTGSCAAFSVKYAVSKALTEVLRTILIDEATSPTFSDLDKTSVNDTFTHSEYYSHHEHLNEVAHLWNGGEIIQASDTLTHGECAGKPLREVQKVWESTLSPVQRELDYLANDVIGAAGLDIYIKEMTPTSIRQKEIPLIVVRTYVPEMARFVVGYGQRPARTARFNSLLKKYGSKGKRDTRHLLHPFS